MRLPVALLFAVGCTKVGAPEVEVDPVTTEQATAFARDVGKVVLPCDETALRLLIDDKAMLARFRRGGTTLSASAAAQQLEHDHVGAKVLCAWQAKAEDYKLLRVRTVDGQQRLLYRRIMKDARTGLRAVGYDELMLGATRSDHKVRIIDVYSFIQGQWLTESLRGLTDATIDSAGGTPEDAKAIADKLQRARTLQQSGEYKQALDLLDALPEKVRKSRATQMMRVSIASALSQDAYKAALDEVAATFPGDASVAMLEVDGAFLRADYDAALRYIDAVDKSIGGDPWQDALRAEALLHRNKPGDLDAAAARAKAATVTEPGLAKGWWAVLDVALGKRDWTGALATMDELTKRFAITFDDAAMHKTPVYAGLVATPEYAAWHTKHSG